MPDDLTPATGVERGCGRRQKGATYLSVPVTSKGGVPLDEFLVCPPRPVDRAALRLEPIGVQLIEIGGITHVFDIVGATHYPNVADMISELRRHGASRRIAGTTDFRRLTPQSRLVLLHERAIIRNADQLRMILRNEERERRPDALGWSPLTFCPPRRLDHMALPIDDPQPEEMCQALYWEDIDGGETVLDPAVPWRTVDRSVGSTTYRARRRPDHFEPVYELAIFAMLPIHHISVIRDPEGGRHRRAVDKANQGSLPVVLEDE
jgi:hypothetical protein